MDPFWKNICEIKLLPLTTWFGYPPDHRKLNDNKIYNQEDNYFDLLAKKGFEIENLCLRLT